MSGPSLELLAFDVSVCCLPLRVVEFCEHLCVGLLSPLLSQGCPYAAVLNRFECIFVVNGCEPKWLVPLGGPLSEPLEYVLVVRRGVALSETCLINGFAGVWCGL